MRLHITYLADGATGLVHSICFIARTNQLQCAPIEVEVWLYVGEYIGLPWLLLALYDSTFPRARPAILIRAVIIHCMQFTNMF
jgi:hypothetical protein